MEKVRTITSPKKLKVIVPSYEALELELPKGIKDEAVHARFTRKTGLKKFSKIFLDRIFKKLLGKFFKNFFQIFSNVVSAYNILTIKAPRVGGIETKKSGEMDFNENFCKNLSQAFASKH